VMRDECCGVTPSPAIHMTQFQDSMTIFRQHFGSAHGIGRSRHFGKRRWTHQLFPPCGIAGSRHRRTDLCPRIVAQSTHTGTSAMARPGQDPPARPIQRVHRRGFEIPYRLAPE
jgi:hypothetical protein